MNFAKKNLYLILLVLIFLIIMYYAYNYITTCVGCDERIYPNVRMNKNPLFKEFIVATADKMIDSSNIFQYKHPFNTKFKSIFSDKEKPKVKSAAKNFFKTAFGISDAYMNLFMYELRVNDELDYKAYYTQSSRKKAVPILDGGYVCFILPKTTVYGTYGGKDGVLVPQGSVIVYGYYIFEGYKIRYWSMCPLSPVKRYDATYTPIDCDLLIEKAPNKNLIGLKGKAQGLYKVINVRGLTHHATVRNVMTFF